MPELTVEATGYSGYIMGTPGGSQGYFITNTTPNYLAVGHGTQFGAAGYRSFLTFDLSAIPEGATIERAVLRLVTTDDWWPIRVPFNILLLDCTYPDPIANGENWEQESLDAMWASAAAAEIVDTLLNTDTITDAEGNEADAEELQFTLDPAHISPSAERRYALVSDAELAAGDPELYSIAAFPISGPGTPTNPHLLFTYSLPEEPDEEAEETVVAVVGPASPYLNLRDVRIQIIDSRAVKPKAKPE